MNKSGLSFFQIGVFVACAIGIVFAVLIFSGKIPLGEKSQTATIKGNLTIWGTLPAEAVQGVTDDIRETYKEVFINYRQISPATFQNNLVNALASGTGPDMVYLTPADIIPNKDRLFEIPYASLPQATFKNTFIDQGNVFLTNTGALALPFMNDPLVMYYNRDLLSNAFIVNPPKTWDDVVDLAKKITVRDDAGVLRTQTVALGTFDNIVHAMDIITAMIFQTGNQIVAWDPTLLKYVSQFASNDTSGNPGVSRALEFFTSFANTGSDHYSWNGSFTSDRDQFLSGRLALYFGYASELEGLREKNPNLNFEVALFPQRTENVRKATFGNMYGLAIMKLSPNKNLALSMMQLLVGKDAFTRYHGNAPYSFPTRRELVTKPSGDAHETLFYQSTIIAQSFLNPDPVAIKVLFKRFVDQINSGSATPFSILSPGESLLTKILAEAQRAPQTSE